jgi:hypothetical protein
MNASRLIHRQTLPIQTHIFDQSKILASNGFPRQLIFNKGVLDANRSKADELSSGNPKWTQLLDYLRRKPRCFRSTHVPCASEFVIGFQSTFASPPSRFSRSVASHPTRRNWRHGPYWNKTVTTSSSTWARIGAAVDTPTSLELGSDGQKQQTGHSSII